MKRSIAADRGGEVLRGIMIVALASAIGIVGISRRTASCWPSAIDTHKVSAS